MRASARLIAARLTVACLVLGAPLAAIAEDRPDPVATPGVFKAVVDCRALADAQERLACYDRTVAALDAARASNDLVVTDKAAIREARRGLFGISLPKLKLFGGGDEVNEIEGTIASVRSAADGMAIFVLEDGARWKQTEGRNQFAKAGQKVKVKRTAMGGFMANINGQPGIRVVRLAN